MQKITPENALAVYASKIGPEGGNALNASGNKKIRRRVLYGAALAATLATNQNKLLVPGDTKTIGKTNFDIGNKLATGRKYLVTGIRILFDTATGPTVTLSTADYKNTAPVSFQNGEIVISQAGNGELLNMPMLPFCPKNTVNVVDDEYTAVIPFVLVDNVETDILLLQAGTAATNIAVRVEFDCIELGEVGRA